MKDIKKYTCPINFHEAVERIEKNFRNNFSISFIKKKNRIRIIKNVSFEMRVKE